MAGHWEIANSETAYDLCVDDGGWLGGSYTYAYNSSTVPGYEHAKCRVPTIAAGGAVCSGVWGEPDGLIGVFVLVLTAPGVVTDFWWAIEGGGTGIDYAANYNNTDAHAVEVVAMTGLSSPTLCETHVAL